MTRLGLVALLVREYDQAIDWFVTRLDWTLRDDTRITADKRWVVIAPPGGGCALLLARAADEARLAAVGRRPRVPVPRDRGHRARPRPVHGAGRPFPRGAAA